MLCCIMIFICSFIILCVICAVFMLLLTGGFIVFSADKKPQTETGSEVCEREPKIEQKEEKKFYINLNGQLIELLTKAEVTKARKDGFNVVQQ